MPGMGQVSPRRAAGHPAPSRIPGWTMGWSRRGSPQAFASCKKQYEEDWERWGLGRLQIPALLLGEEVRGDGCGPPRPQAAVGDHKKKKKKNDPGAVGLPAPWPASRSPPQGGVWTPSCIAPRSRGHFANILATTSATLEWFCDGYQNPKERIQPSISLSASPRRGCRHPGKAGHAVWVPPTLSPRYLQTDPPMGLRSGILHADGVCGHPSAGAGMRGELRLPRVDVPRFGPRSCCQPFAHPLFLLGELQDWVGLVSEQPCGAARDGKG